ncbi:hypothetical protein CROQUDRAFT_662491 [Cronartium quercuum f. sp. fusiforme G11]|uniref:Uncharacterized protein n=1 Tax=Cronartium quercuum f. sp. fusiforme G11 TaxID=708437 RepID=A0A9P6T9F8_9BASI|nr:hypothetical protein CROQUDRAFT_662491 [Cronartium quercuum f. sp. fusiforme G11]
MGKRPLGLKATKNNKKSRTLANNAATVPDNRSSGQSETSYTTVALRTTSATDQDKDGPEDDGLTIEDLLELKSQAEDQLANFRLLSNPESAAESGNLLRGICHECHRRVQLAALEPSRELECSTMSFLGWATLELGLFLTPLGADPRAELILPDEPDALNRWCAISSRALSSEKDSGALSGHFRLVQPTLDLALALLDSKSDDIVEKLQTWGAVMTEELVKTQIVLSHQLWLISSALEIIEAVSPTWDDHVVESHGQQKLFDKLRTLLESLAMAAANLPVSDDPLDKSRAAVARYSITYQLANRALVHGSALAEKIEDQYFPESEKEPVDEDEFPIDTSDPNYQNTLIALNLADQHFTIAKKLMETDPLLKDMGEEVAKDLKTQLSETLLTLGNMLEPGPKREAVYERASELGGFEF